MKTKHFFLAFFALCIAVASYGQTQEQFTTRAYNRYQKADKILNQTYRNILQEYKSDTEFITNLKKSQRLWIAFRDAEVRVKYPNRGSGTYPSSHQMCWYSYLEDLTKKRTKELSVWINGIEEGDVCAGSVKKK